jgi:hypothetical protein
VRLVEVAGLRGDARQVGLVDRLGRLEEAVQAQDALERLGGP